jgi:hypothetical protein
MTEDTLVFSPIFLGLYGGLQNRLSDYLVMFVTNLSSIINLNE